MNRLPMILIVVMTFVILDLVIPVVLVAPFYYIAKAAGRENDRIVKIIVFPLVAVPQVIMRRSPLYQSWIETQCRFTGVR